MLAGLVLAASAAAASGEYRFGVFVGNDTGGAGESRLVFATADAAKVHDLFTDIGGIAPDDAVLLTGETRRDVQGALVLAKERIGRAEARGDHTTLVFYYSGHGDADGLHLGDTIVAHEELRAWLEATGADVRVAFVDACRSGAAVRAKGGVRGPGYAFAVDVERTAGTAIVTSSAETEFAQESDEVGGGFFTYYLHTGLAGAADIDGDEVVTLDEIYRWVHTETVFRTRSTPGTQTPSYEFDLSGSGAVALTELGDASARLVFPGGLDGTFAIWDESRKRYVAEVAGAEASTIAVRPGVYFVHRRAPGWVDEASYTVRDGQTAHVTLEGFQSVAYEDTAARGDIDRAVRRASRPDLTLQLAVGGRSFGKNSVFTHQYVPRHAISGIVADGRLQNGLWAQAFVLGGSGSGTLNLPEYGEMNVDVGSASIGGTLGVMSRTKIVHAGIGFRGESAWFWRSFPDGEGAPQGAWGVAPGAGVVLGAHTRHLRADLGIDLMLYSASWDQREFPSYGATTLRVGYTF